MSDGRTAGERARAIRKLRRQAEGRAVGGPFAVSLCGESPSSLLPIYPWSYAPVGGTFLATARPAALPDIDWSDKNNGG